MAGHEISEFNSIEESDGRRRSIGHKVDGESVKSLAVCNIYRRVCFSMYAFEEV